MFNKRVLVFLSGATLIVVTVYYISLKPSYAFNCTRNRICDVERGTTDTVNKREKMLASLRRSSYLDLRKFDINGNDIMVFLHVQKTGGTSFGRNLVKRLVLERPCRKTIAKRFECSRPNSSDSWLYSRYSTDWICGLHADWTTLSSCLPKILQSYMGAKDLKKTRLFYVSLFRDPIDRFLSEFKHVQRGATWKTSTYVCNGTKHELPFCYSGQDWRDVRLSEFLGCPHNLAFNRQTRMLADLNEVGCYKNQTLGPRARERGKLMLESAKRNLRDLSYFGLVEYQKESQYIFEKTFGMKFKNDFRQASVDDTWSFKARKDVSPKQLLQIRQVNRLDRQLYSYAKAIFFRRLKYFKMCEDYNDQLRNSLTTY